jgi:hypothetical protein
MEKNVIVTGGARFINNHDCKGLAIVGFDHIPINQLMYCLWYYKCDQS